MDHQRPQTALATPHDLRERERRRGSAAPWTIPAEQGEQIPAGERAGAILDALPGSARQVCGRTGLPEPYVRQTLSRLKGLGAVRSIGYAVEELPGSGERRGRATVYARNY